MEEKKFEILDTGDGCYRTTLNRKYERRQPWKPESPGRILSFMPGMVEEILVAVGDPVKEGQLVSVFRAMKMSNRMTSPVSGKVKAIHVSPGDNVPKGTVLLEIE